MEDEAGRGCASCGGCLLQLMLGFAGYLVVALTLKIIFGISLTIWQFSLLCLVIAGLGMVWLWRASFRQEEQAIAEQEARETPPEIPYTPDLSVDVDEMGRDEIKAELEYRGIIVDGGASRRTSLMRDLLRDARKRQA